MNLRDLKKEVDEACARADRSGRSWDEVNIDLCLHVDGTFRRFKTRGIDITSTPKGFPAKLTVETIEADGGSENPLKEVDDKFIEELDKSIEFHRTNQDDAHGVGPAVMVSLIEVRRAFTEALKVRDSIGKDDRNHGQ